MYFNEFDYIARQPEEVSTVVSNEVNYSSSCGQKIS